MEISKRTIEILKNFSTINQSLYYDPATLGNMLITKSVAGNIIASAEIEETFPVEFAIFNINEFLSALTLFEKPDLEFDDKYLTIRNVGSKRGGLKFFFCNPALITAPKKKPVAPEANITFALNGEQLAHIEKSAKILNVEDLVLYGDSDGVHAIVTNKGTATSNDFEVTLSNDSQGEFKYYFKQSNWKFLAGNYHVGISVKDTPTGISGIGFFTSQDGTIKYGVAIERV